ncbi:MAG TPA: cupin domain-containing protein [Rhizomicrobium sp.]|jgi:uncharacterized cupin superfamily protein|nr:cupin domain-containing protein [Rhizomicrobium sp.]
MTRFAVADTAHALKPAPIEPSWIEAGSPMARNCVLFHSSDKTAWTMLWDCSAGEIRWRYSFDETIHFLEGSVIITVEGSAPRRFGPGDVIFFPAGAVAQWKIDTYIRKLAFCQLPTPRPLRLPLRALRRLARILGKTAAALVAR